MCMRNMIAKCGMLLFAAALLSGSVVALAQSYPSKPIKLIVPFPPGGTTDIVARILADPLGRELGQPVIVDNRGGAGGTIGIGEVGRGAPDGYVLGVASVSTFGVNPAVYKKLPYNAIADFTPVGTFAGSPNVMAVHPSTPGADVAQFFRYLKANPGKLTYASAGNGSTGHMMGELFKKMTKTHIVHIPYRGSGPALNDVLAGQVNMIFDNLPSSLPHIQAGKLRALAVAAPARLPSLPDVPTFGELALVDVNEPAWFGIVAPAKVPPQVVTRLNDAIGKVVQTAEVRDRLAAAGVNSMAGKPQELDQRIRREIDRMRTVAKYANITLD